MGRRSWTLWLLLLLLLLVLGVGQAVVDADQTGALQNNKTIRIGYLMDNVARAGAINVAIEQAQRDGLLREYNFRYVYIYGVSQCRQ